MCRIRDVFTPRELKTLGRKEKTILQEYGKLLAVTNPAIREIIKKDPKIRKKLKGLLATEFRRLQRV